MKFGFIIPHNYGLADPQKVINIGVKAEQLGFDSIWVNHHVLNAGYILDRLGDKPYYDSLTTLTYLAALTNRVRLGTTVLVLPYFNPLVLAKSLATLDQLSGGRLTIGVGVGALRHESECLGSDYATRGAYTNEAIAIMKELWTKDDPEFNGEFFSFSGIKFSPKPKQNPHPPIWIGGSSNAALRRTAQLGDGWHPNGVFPDELGAQVKRLETRLDAAGRRLSDITLSIRNELDVLASPVAKQQGPAIGTPDQLVSIIESYQNIGVQEMIFSVSTDDVSRIHRVMEAFADKVMPRTKG